MDEMWGRVYCKQTPCWLWHAINHENGEIIAFVLGDRKHDMLYELYNRACEEKSVKRKKKGPSMIE